MWAPRESVTDYHTEIFATLNLFKDGTIELNLKQWQGSLTTRMDEHTLCLATFSCRPLSRSHLYAEAKTRDSLAEMSVPYIHMLHVTAILAT